MSPPTLILSNLSRVVIHRIINIFAQATTVISIIAIDTAFVPSDRLRPALAPLAVSKSSRSIVTAPRDRTSCPVLQRTSRMTWKMKLA